MIVFIVFLAIMAIAATAAIYSNIHFILRCILVMSLIMSSVYAFSVIMYSEGRPIEITEITGRHVVVAQYVDLYTEQIYILSQSESGHPKYYVTPYSKGLHEAINKGLALGSPFILEKEGGKPTEGMAGQEDGDGAGSISLRSDAYEVYQMPPPLLPPKSAQ